MAANNPYALYFDGVNDYAYIAAANTFITNPALKGQLTIEFWGSIISGYVPFSSGATRTGYRGIAFDYRNRSVTISNGTRRWRISNAYMPSGWHHYALTWGNNRLQYYVDSILQADVGYSSYIANNREQELCIGNHRIDGNSPCRCYVDEFRVWDHYRTQDQIQDDMYKSLSGAEPGLFICLHFNEGKENIAYDSSPNGKHATIVGATWVEGQIDLHTDDDRVIELSATAHGRATGTAKPLLGHMGWALQCDGIDDYISLGTLGDFGKNIGSSKISVTFKTPKGYAPGAPTTLYRIINDPARGLELNVRLNTERYMPNPGTYAPGKTLFYISTLAEKHIIGGHINNHTLYDGDFHELVVDYTDIKNANIHVYIDGAPQTFENYTHKMNIEATPYNLDYPLLLGASNVRGDISEHAQITVQNIKITISAQPHAEYPIDEGAGTTINDTSGNGYHGTIYGASWITDALISISTISADNISASRMNIKGELLDLGDHTQAECYFQYTTDPNFNTGIIETPHQIMTTTGEFEQLVTNLDNSNTYYYRAVADYID